MASATAISPSSAVAPTASPAAALKLANVLYEKKGPIAYVTVNRPKVLNALNTNLGGHARGIRGCPQ